MNRKNAEKSGAKTAVIGHPIAHSKSPLIHNYWLNHYNLPGHYEALDIPPENLKKDVDNLVNNGYCGFNVTVPHKISIMDLCYEIDEIASSIGAVNTVTIKDGKLYGANTDAYGFIENIKNHAKLYGFSWQLNDGPAVILGAGGAARAAVYGLLQEDVPEIILLNRSKERAENLALMDKRIKVIEWEKRADSLENANFLVNTTSLGMKGQPPLEIDLSRANPSITVHDIVYNPLHTQLLKNADKAHLRTITGIGMLLHQARPGFKLWNGVMPDVTAELEDLVLT